MSRGFSKSRSASQPSLLSIPSRATLAVTAAAIALAALAAYHRTFSFPFVFDDLPGIRDNLSIRKVTAWTEVLAPPTHATTSGRPVLNATLAVSFALSGETTWGYHLVNLLIHVLAALTLCGVVRRTLLLPRYCGRFGADALPLALLVALLWLLHPLQTESVTYLVQRAESLMGLCYLLTFYAFLRGVQSGDATNRWHAVATITCALGMGTKEVMVSAPVLLLLYDRTFVAGSFRSAWQLRQKLYLSLGLTWLLLGYLVASEGGNRGGSIGFGIGIGWWAHALTQFDAVTHYLRLTLWPNPLVFEYEPEWVGHLSAVAPQVLFVTGLLVITAVGIWRAAAVGFAGAWCFAILAPTSLLPAPTQLIVEHRMYLPLAALIALAALALYQWIGRWSFVALLALAVGYGALTVRRNEDYRSEIALWADTVAKRPRNALAHGSLGNALSRAGRWDEAHAECTEAVRLDPSSALLHYNLGLVLAKLGSHREAIEAYEKAVRLQPDYPDAHNNLAVALARAHRPDDALQEFATALRQRPADAEAHFNLGTLLAELGRGPDALREFDAAVRLRPDYPAALVAAGTTLASMNQLDEAMERYRRAAALHPRDAIARNKIALLLLATGRAAEAVAFLEETLRVAPDDPDTLAHLAFARSRLRSLPPRE